MDLGWKQLKTHAPQGMALMGVILAACLAGLLSGCASGSGPEDAYKQLTRVDHSKPYIGISKT